MQKITVADIHIKTGTGKKGSWTLTIITDTSGARFSGFDKKLVDIGKGAVIEAEIEIDGDYNNIKEWKLISEGSPQDSGTGGSQMSKDEWAEKDARERISIERQNAATNVCNLIIAGKIGVMDALGEKVLSYLSTKLDAKTAPPKTKVGSPEAAEENTSIQNVGDLLTRCAKINVTKAHLLKLLSLDDVASIKDLDMAWAKAQADAQFNLL